jgi:phosphatidate cytidylyltransferase
MTRLISAAILIAVVLGVLIWLPLWATAGLAALVAALGAAEVAVFASRSGGRVSVAFVACAAAAMSLSFVLGELRGLDAAETVLPAILLAALVVGGTLMLALGPPDATTLARAATMVMAPMYVGLPLGAIVWVRCALGAPATLWMLGTVVVSDSAQYYTGRALGRRKLAPAISPAKTVEGAVGGLVAAAAVAFFIGPRVMPGLSPVGAALTGLALATAGIAGDLFESLLKRGVGVKDSSALIPGHGGVLDRIDAQLFAAPVFYLIVRYVVWRS